MFSSPRWVCRGILLTILSVAISFAPVGSSAEDSAADIGSLSLISMRGVSVKWGKPHFGTPPTVIRYAFIDRAVARPEARNCKSMEPFPSVLKKGGVSAAEATAEIHKAFGAWQEVSNVTFEYVSDADEADVLIGTQAAPRGIAFADVALAEPHVGLLASIRQGAICFNPDVQWETAFDGDRSTYDIRYVAVHEIGHVLGLDHAPAGRSTIMGFRYRENARVPQADDIAGVDYLYGPRHIPTAVNTRAHVN